MDSSKPLAKQQRHIRAAAYEDLHGYVVELCKSYLAEHPKHGTVWLRYGYALSHLSRYEEAEFAFNQATQYCSEKMRQIIFLSRGEMHHRKGDYMEAEKNFLLAIQEAPPEGYHYIYAGNSAFRRGDLEVAEKYLRDAVNCNDYYQDEAYHNLGGVLLAKEQYDEAAECYRHALETDYKPSYRRLKDVERILKSKASK